MCDMLSVTGRFASIVIRIDICPLLLPAVILCCNLCSLCYVLLQLHSCPVVMCDMCHVLVLSLQFDCCVQLLYDNLFHLAPRTDDYLAFPRLAKRNRMILM